MQGTNNLFHGLYLKPSILEENYESKSGMNSGHHSTTMYSQAQSWQHEPSRQLQNLDNRNRHALNFVSEPDGLRKKYLKEQKAYFASFSIPLSKREKAEGRDCLNFNPDSDEEMELELSDTDQTSRDPMRSGNNNAPVNGPIQVGLGLGKSFGNMTIGGHALNFYKNQSGEFVALENGAIAKFYNSKTMRYESLCHGVLEFMCHLSRHPNKILAHDKIMSNMTSEFPIKNCIRGLHKLFGSDCISVYVSKDGSDCAYEFRPG